MSSCIHFVFHEGHNVQPIVHAGKAAIICMDCGILADIEAIGGHISPEEAINPDKKSPKQHLNQLSKGIKL